MHTSYLTHVLPAELIVSIGLGFAFVPFSSTALIGVAPHDAGVASALVNATQQVGGSLGTALLNTVAASATASYLLAHHGNPGVADQALVHGYSMGFTVSAIVLLVAVVVAATLIRASRHDLPAEEHALAGAERFTGLPTTARRFTGALWRVRAPLPMDRLPRHLR